MFLSFNLSFNKYPRLCYIAQSTFLRCTKEWRKKVRRLNHTQSVQLPLQKKTSGLVYCVSSNVQKANSLKFDSRLAPTPFLHMYCHHESTFQFSGPQSKKPPDGNEHSSRQSRSQNGSIGGNEIGSTILRTLRSEDARCNRRGLGREERSRSGNSRTFQLWSIAVLNAVDLGQVR